MAKFKKVKILAPYPKRLGGNIMKQVYKKGSKTYMKFGRHFVRVYKPQRGRLKKLD